MKINLALFILKAIEYALRYGRKAIKSHGRLKKLNEICHHVVVFLNFFFPYVCGRMYYRIFLQEGEIRAGRREKRMARNNTIFLMATNSCGPQSRRDYKEAGKGHVISGALDMGTARGHYFIEFFFAAVLNSTNQGLQVTQ